MTTATEALHERIAELERENAELKEELTNTITEERDKGIPLYEGWTDFTAPRVVMGPDKKPAYWLIALNEYQRSNLLWLLCDLAGYCKEGIEPFTLANTGDWLGELANMLRVNHNDPGDNPHPNVSVDQIRERLRS